MWGRGPDYILGLGPCLRRSVSLDLLRVGQTPDLMIKATPQDALMTRTYPRNVQERRKPQRKNIIYLKESCCHRIKCIITTFLAAFMWRRRLNSNTFSIATHKNPRTVPDGTGTQVRVQMANKCEIKMVRGGP